jgi:superfamily I DNA/RNA helicase
MFGTPLYSDGDLLLETVHRFKGQAAPCVILTEVDFEALDELVERRLFVGATRASMKLILVLSERADNCLRERLEAA